jgi:hypothetical protein
VSGAHRAKGPKFRAFVKISQKPALFTNFRIIEGKRRNEWNESHTTNHENILILLSPHIPHIPYKRTNDNFFIAALSLLIHYKQMKLIR